MDLHSYLDNVVGDNYEIDEALVMGPYISDGFFKEFFNYPRGTRKCAPKSSLTLLADDGWDQVQLDSISRLHEEKNRTRCQLRIRRVRAESKIGLVHAKIIFLKLKNAAGSYTKNILLMGSANASAQGFGIHAETFITVDLADLQVSQRKSVFAYLEALKTGASIDPVIFSFGRASWVSLPLVKIVNDDVYSSFDAWLRRGRLCHKYQPDSSFGRLQLRLKNPLPPRGFEKDLNSLAFGSETDSQKFSRAYAGMQSEDGERRAVWREQYFIETYYGHWASGECYESLSDTFRASNFEERGRLVTRIAICRAHDKEEWIQEFRDAVSDLTTRLPIKTSREDERLSYFFEMKRGKVDLDFYREQANKKIDFDSVLANDSGFRSRYVNGYIFPRVPKLDEDFEDFALSWCQGVINKLSKSRTSNKIAQVVSKQVGDFYRDPSVLLEHLREVWPDDRVREYYETYGISGAQW